LILVIIAKFRSLTRYW